MAPATTHHTLTPDGVTSTALNLDYGEPTTLPSTQQHTPLHDDIGEENTDSTEDDNFQQPNPPRLLSRPPTKTTGAFTVTTTDQQGNNTTHPSSTADQRYAPDSL